MDAGILHLNWAIDMHLCIGWVCGILLLIGQTSPVSLAALCSYCVRICRSPTANSILHRLASFLARALVHRTRRGDVLPATV